MIITVYDYLYKIYEDIKAELKFQDNYFFVSFMIYIEHRLNIVYKKEDSNDLRLWIDDNNINTLLDIFQDYIYNLDDNMIKLYFTYPLDDNYKDMICNIIQNYKTIT